MTLPLSPPLLSIACTHGDHRECIREYVLGDIVVLPLVYDSGRFYPLEYVQVTLPEVEPNDLDLHGLVLWDGSRGTIHCDCPCHGGA